jgi:hypothetical protein
VEGGCSGVSLQQNPFFQQLQLTPEEIIASKLNQPIQSRRQLADIIAQSYMAWRSQQLQKIQEYKSELKSEISKEEEETIKQASGESILEWFERLPPEIKNQLYRLAPAKTEFYQWLQKNPDFRLQVYEMYKNIMMEQYLQQLPEHVEPSQVENWLETLGKDESRLLMAISGSPEYKPQIQIGGSGETKIGVSGRAAPIINIPEQATGITRQSFVAGGGGILAVIPRIPVEKSLTEQLLQIPTTPELEAPKQALAGVTAAFETATLGLLPTYPTPPTIFKAAFELAKGKGEALEFLKTHPAYAIGEAAGEVLTALAFTKLLPKPVVKETITIKPEAISEAKIPSVAGMEVERAMQVRIRAADLPMQAKLEDIIGYSGKTLMVREAGLLGPTETILGRTIKTGEETQKLISGMLGEKPTMKVTVTGPEFIETYWRMPSGLALGEVRSQAVELTRSITGTLSPIDKVKLLFGLDVEKTIIERATQIAEKPQPQLLTVTETKISGLLIRGPEPIEKAFKVFAAGGGETETVTGQILKTVSEVPVKIEFKLPSGIAAGAITLSAAAMPHTIPSVVGREIGETETLTQIQPPEVAQPLKINFKIPLKIELPKLDFARSTSALEKPSMDLAPKTGPQKSLLSFPEVQPPKLTPQLQPKLETKTRETTSTIEQEMPRIRVKIPLPQLEKQIPTELPKVSFKLPSKPPSLPEFGKPFHIPFSFGLGSQKTRRGKRKRKTKRKRKYREYVNPFPELNEAVKGIEKALKSLKIKF